MCRSKFRSDEAEAVKDTYEYDKEDDSEKCANLSRLTEGEKDEKQNHRKTKSIKAIVTVENR